jgi:hypothetical protein
MNRRTVLATVATVAGTAGCLDATPGTGTETTTDNAKDRTTDPATTTRNERSTDPALNPPDSTDVFADIDCPSFQDSADETVCYHTADTAAAPLLLTVSPEVFDYTLADADIETVTFTLYNRSAWPVSLNPYKWALKRREGGSWTHVAPEQYVEPVTQVKPGETLRWVLPSQAGWTAPDDETYALSPELDAGLYAFQVSVRPSIHMSPTPDAPKPPDSVELIALFQLEDAVDPKQTPASTGTTVAESG